MIDWLIDWLEEVQNVICRNEETMDPLKDWLISSIHNPFFRIQVSISKDHILPNIEFKKHFEKPAVGHKSTISLDFYYLQTQYQNILTCASCELSLWFWSINSAMVSCLSLSASLDDVTWWVSSLRMASSSVWRSTILFSYVPSVISSLLLSSCFSCSNAYWNQFIFLM